MIDLQEEGTCSMARCSNTGLRARGAQDIEGIASRTSVIRKSFYCEPCLEAGAARSFSGSITTGSRKRHEDHRKNRLAETGGRYE